MVGGSDRRREMQANQKAQSQGIDQEDFAAKTQHGSRLLASLLPCLFVWLLVREMRSYKVDEIDCKEQTNVGAGARTRTYVRERFGEE